MGIEEKTLEDGRAAVRLDMGLMDHVRKTLTPMEEDGLSPPAVMSILVACMAVLYKSAWEGMTPIDDFCVEITTNLKEVVNGLQRGKGGIQ